MVPYQFRRRLIWSRNTFVRVFPSVHEYRRFSTNTIQILRVTNDHPLLRALKSSLLPSYSGCDLRGFQYRHTPSPTQPG